MRLQSALMAARLHALSRSPAGCSNDANWDAVIDESGVTYLVSQRQQSLD